MTQKKNSVSPAGGGNAPGGTGTQKAAGKEQGSRMALLGRVISLMLKSYPIQFLLVLVCILISALATLQGTLFQKTLIDDYITPMLAAGGGDFSALAAALVRLAVIFACGVAASYTYQRLMVTISEGTMRNLRIDLFRHMERLPIRYFDRNAHGDIMSVYTNDVDTLRQLISQSIPQLVNSSVTLVVTFVSMIALTWQLTIVSVLMVLVTIFFSGKLAGRSGRYFIQQQRDLGRENGYIEEMLGGQKVVKVFCHEEKAIEDFTALNNQLRESSYLANRYASIMMPVNGSLGNVSYVLCAVIGAVLALGGFGGITLGTLVSYLTLNKNFSQPITQISQQMNSIIMAMAGADRIFRMMDEEPEVNDGYVKIVRVQEDADGTLHETPQRTGKWAWKFNRSDIRRPGCVNAKAAENAQGGGDTVLIHQHGEIRLDHVTFGYTDEKIVLHDISLDALPGQKIAFVGSTGAGKTTITNLINRFYDIQSGTITYDGIDIMSMCKNDLRKSLGMVLQDTHLFTGTVMDNIRYGRLDASDADCERAARLANADGFIRRLPDGYHTMLRGDGANLSQGQRQLLAIARAAVANPPALILDEATSSIDTRTEELVQRGMDALMEGRTTFVIAHRLSTVRNSDCIIVLEQGRIIEQGTHEELIEARGKYYQLYTGNQISA